MKGHETGQRTTIESAARHLAVSTKTIQRYLARGVLTKIKQGTRTFLLMSEVEELNRQTGMGQTTDGKSQIWDRGTGRCPDTVTMDRDRYEGLLIEVGELRKQNQMVEEFKKNFDHQAELLEQMEKRIAQLETRIELIAAGKSEKVSRSESGGTGSKPSQPYQKPWWQK